MKKYLFLLILFGISVSQSFGETPYHKVDGTNLKFAYSDTAIKLVNETSCDVKDIEFQTFPIASNALDRILGRGSYYYNYPLSKKR